jgi:hypothetical protein
MVSTIAPTRSPRSTPRRDGRTVSTQPNNLFDDLVDLVNDITGRTRMPNEPRPTEQLKGCLGCLGALVAIVAVLALLHHWKLLPRSCDPGATVTHALGGPARPPIVVEGPATS